MKSDKYIAKIGWGSYLNFEGPLLFKGTQYVLPDQPDFWSKVLKVVGTTEGNSINVVNMYDSCILTVGLIQLCEKLYKVSDLLGECSKVNHDLLMSYLKEFNADIDFKLNAQNHYRFYLHGTEVRTTDQMKLVFLGGSTGLKGQWNPAQTAYARRVAAVFASMWDEPEFAKVQLDFVKKDLTNYIWPDSKKLLFFDNYPTDGFEGCLRAGYLSFAANAPVWADHWLQVASQQPEWNGTPEQRCIISLKTMTFGPKVTIWPGRYDRIRPVLEYLFNVNLPDLSSDLTNWKMPKSHTFITIKDVQQELVDEGYDLGPSKADGVLGPKTLTAIRAFQVNHGILADGHVNHETTLALEAEFKVRNHIIP